MIAGFCIPDSGEIILDGRDITNKAPNLRNIGMVFQDYALWPHMNVMQHLTFGLNIKKIPSKEINKRITQVIGLMRLDGLENRYPKQLSGGQQQRVALARALVMEPRVLLLDEPLSNLDKKLRDSMKIELRRLQKMLGITMVFVTHDQSEALALSDHIVVMEKGKVIQYGSSYEIYENPNSIFVAGFIGNANFIDASLLDVRNGNVVVSIAEGRWTLEFPRGSSHSFNAKDHVKIFIRPTNIDLLADKDGSCNLVPVEYVNSVYEGSINRVLLRIKDTSIELVAEVPSNIVVFQEQKDLFVRFRSVRLLTGEVR